jgi:hypothetical protein
MKLGIVLRTTGPTPRLDLDFVLEAERLGFDSAWTSEAWGGDATLRPPSNGQLPRSPAPWLAPPGAFFAPSALRTTQNLRVTYERCIIETRKVTSRSYFFPAPNGLDPATLMHLD